MNTGLYVIFDTFKGSIFVDDDGFPFENLKEANEKCEDSVRYAVMYLGRPDEEKVESASQKSGGKMKSLYVYETDSTLKKIGITHEVIALQGNDGGVEAVALCYSKKIAEKIADILNKLGGRDCLFRKIKSKT